MKLTSWLPYVTSRILVPLASDGKPRRGRRSGCTRLAGELLETRALLSAVWEGGVDGFGDGTSWNDPFNWASDTLPGPSDDVVIDLGANAFTVSIAGGDHVVSSLTSQAAVSITGSLTLANESVFAKSLSINNGGTLQIDESLTVGGLLRLADNYGGVPATVEGIGPGVRKA